MNTRSIFRRFDSIIGRRIWVFIIAWVLVGGLTSPASASETIQGGTLVFGAENEFAGFDLLKARGLLRRSASGLLSFPAGVPAGSDRTGFDHPPLASDLR